MASKKKESEEQLRRRSRSNTNQKVILVPNLTEETLGPNNWEAGQECLTDAPKLSLAMQRRRVDIIHKIFFCILLHSSQKEATRMKARDDRQEQRCLERGQSKRGGR